MITNRQIIKYKSYSEARKLERSYHLFDEDDNEIGTIEGNANKYGELVSVVKVYDNKNQKKGFGFEAFKKVFCELNDEVPITKIVGSWHNGGEFQDFDEGMSTNLKIFLTCRKNKKDLKNCAFSTPTGKWAKKLGFNDCEIVLISSDVVNINFKK